MEHEQQHRFPVRRAVAIASADVITVASPELVHRAPGVLAGHSRSMLHDPGDAVGPCRPGSFPWERVYSFDSLHAAYRRARRAKRYHADVLAFSANIEAELITLQNELLWRTYQTSPYRLFQVHDPKPRQIMAPAFRDRVVHHALCAVIEPLAERRFVFDSYACRVGKGTHAALRRLQTFLRRARGGGRRVWALKADVSRYFPSIPHSHLLARWRRIVDDPDILWLLREILSSAGAESGGHMCGLPIGALTSQLSANVYLDPVDHFVKEDLRERFYLRYMDDMIVLGHDKDRLREVRAQLAEYLGGLALTLNSRTVIIGAASGIPFVGYRIWADHARVLQSALRRMRRRLRGLRRGFAAGSITAGDVGRRVRSWVAHANHADSWRVRDALLGDAVFCTAERT